MIKNIKNKYMISGKNKNTSELGYREILRDSSSSLKMFAENKRKYYKQYIEGISQFDDGDDNKAIIIGKITETLLLEEEKFDNKFYLSVCLNSPTGLMAEFVNALYKHTLEATDDKGNVNREFEEICKDAHADSGFKIGIEAVLKKFIGTDNEIFYKELREIKSRGLIVVTTQDVENAERIVEELKTNFVTADIINLVNSKRWEVINQFQVENYEIDGHFFKSMLDKVIADNVEKILQPIDLKISWNVERFYEEYYLKRLSYIQAYLYYKALESLTRDVNHKWYNYKVLPIKFIVADSINYYNPLIYTLNDNDMRDAYMGFEHKGRKYKGVKTLIDELKFAQENDLWNISKENYLNNGIVNIRG